MRPETLVPGHVFKSFFLHETEVAATLCGARANNNTGEQGEKPEGEKPCTNEKPEAPSGHSNSS